MKPRIHFFWLAACLFSWLATPLKAAIALNYPNGEQVKITSSLNKEKVIAQIVPDNTLPVPSIVTPQGNTQLITGGSTAGSNLFHSFQQFSVPADSTAYFNNAAAIQNIITRVTGGSLSRIDGILKANGTANLFLLNPNGIIFGPQASLNIGGAFVATTANRLIFADGTAFPASPARGTAPLLTVSVPIGVQLGSQAAPIQVQGASLVASGLTLAGGNIQLSGANLQSNGGDIQLAAVTNGQWFFSEPSTSNPRGGSQPTQYGDILLSDASVIDSSGPGSGSILLQGRNITLADGSGIAATTQDNPGGTLAFRASQTLELGGISTDGQVPSSIITETQGAGVAGDVQITARRLIVRDGAQVLATTKTSGAGGNIAVEASDSVELAGDSSGFVSGLFSQTEGSATAGQITIDTSRLIVRDGAQVNVNTFGSGDAGVLTVRAADSVELSGTGQAVNGLFAQTQRESTGAGGSIAIQTRRLIVRDGAQVSASTFGSGNAGELTVRAADSVELSGAAQEPSGLFAQVEPDASGAGGDLTIKTRRLTVRDGAQASTTTFGSGAAGNLSVRASESVDVAGTSADGGIPSGLFSRSTSTADAGGVAINTNKLSVSREGFVAVSDRGSGNAGDVIINANSLLVSGGTINAETASGEGGNIFIQAKTLQLSRNSNITTTAAGTGNGGNLTIAANTFAAVENSDIRANAFAGRGGNIIISAEGLFRSADSDITASSQLGVNGVVEIKTPQNDVSKGLTTYQNPFANTDQLLAGNCLVRRNKERAKFVVTGTGGLPAKPDEALDRYNMIGVQELPRQRRSGEDKETYLYGEPLVGDRLIEAQAMVFAPNGEASLVAYAPPGTPPQLELDVCTNDNEVTD